MNPRHAAALALVGWYLMAPAPEDLSAPISRWDIVTSYDSATACEKQRMSTVDRMQKAIDDEFAHHEPIAGGAQAFAHEQCIATDDPRLKEK
jgi:hypothetical protein